MIEGTNVAGAVTGLSGRHYTVNLLSFDPETYHFRYDDITDVTDDLRFADKLLLVPDFDPATEGYRVNHERGAGSVAGGIKPLEDSTAVILADNLLNRPLDAPLEALDSTVKKLMDSSGFRTITVFTVVGLLIYLATKDR